MVSLEDMVCLLGVMQNNKLFSAGQVKTSCLLMVNCGDVGKMSSLRVK